MGWALVKIILKYFHNPIAEDIDIINLKLLCVSVRINQMSNYVKF